MTEKRRAPESIQSQVRADLVERERLGVERYGTALYPHNGRDALRDLYEELLDACCYVRQALEERKVTERKAPESVIRELCHAASRYIDTITIKGQCDCDSYELRAAEQAYRAATAPHRRE